MSLPPLEAVGSLTLPGLLATYAIFHTRRADKMTSRYIAALERERDYWRTRALEGKPAERMDD